MTAKMNESTAPKKAASRDPAYNSCNSNADANNAHCVFSSTCGVVLHEAGTQLSGRAAHFLDRSNALSVSVHRPFYRKGESSSIPSTSILRPEFVDEIRITTEEVVMP